MKPMLAAALLATASGAAWADGGMTVPLPDTSGLAADEARALITEVAQVNVITSNCPAYPVSDAEWTLIAGTGDKRIEAMRLAEVYRARVVDATTSSFVFELTGGRDKIDTFIALMAELGLVEVARTGIVAIARGKDAA